MGTFFSTDIWLMIYRSITWKHEGERVIAELILSNNSSPGLVIPSERSLGIVVSPDTRFRKASSLKSPTDRIHSFSIWCILGIIFSHNTVWNHINTSKWYVNF